MKRTTMTVAAFMVAAAASYAAAVTPKNAGVEVTVAKSNTEASVEITLKKGTYALTSDKGTLAAKIGDAGVNLENIVVVDDAGATLKVTVKVDKDDAKDQTVTLNLTPKAADWKAYVEAKQNTLSVAFVASQALPQDQKFEVTKREALLTQGIELQKTINALGIEDYNKYLEEGGKLADLDSKLADYENAANAATANNAQYDKAIAAWKDICDTNLENLKKAYDASEKTPAINAAYEEMQKAVDAYKTTIDKAYEAGTADKTFTDEKIKEGVEKLQKDIDDLATNLASGKENLLAYNAVKTAIDARITVYNDAVNEIYGAMVAIEADTYQDYYTKALAELNKKLKTINDVKAENEAAYKAGTHTSAKQAEMVAKLPAANKDAFIDTEIKAQIAEVASLHGAYERFVKKIDDYKANKDAYNDAVNDERKDSKDKVIKTYFSDKRNVIFGTNRKKGMLDNLRAQLDAQNKLHKHTDETTWNTGDNSWENIEAKKAELDADLDEYKEFVKIQQNAEDAKTYWDNDVKEAAKRGIKQKVEDMTKDGFVATAHFSSKAVNTALEKYLTAGDVYVLGSQYDEDVNKHTPCHDFIYDGGENGDNELFQAFDDAIDAYFKAANAAWNNFNTINDAIAGYNVQINGKGEAGKNDYVESWANVVKNGNVIVGINSSYNPSKPAETGQTDPKTYDEAKATQQAVKDAAKKALDEALTLGSDKAVDFSKALDDLAKTDAGDEGKVTVAAKKIAALKESYSADQETWFSYTNYKAAADALEEATAKVDALTKKIQTGDPADYISYAAADYGTAAADALNKEISNSDAQKLGFKQQIEAQQTAIGKVPTDPTKALPALDDAKKALAEIEKAIDAHLTKAAAYKATFAEVKGRKDNINKQINGNADPKDKVASIIELLGTVYAAASETGSNAEAVLSNFTAKVTAFNTALTTLWDDINAAADIKAGLADVTDKDGKVTKEGFNTRLVNILNDANNLRTLAVNEDENQKACNEWDGLIQKYRTIKVNNADVNQSVADIVAAAEVSIKAADENAAVTTNGEQYFLNLINSKVSETEASYGAQINAQKTAAGTAYTAKNKDGYTDTEKNLVKMLPTLKTNLKNIIDTVDGLGAKAKQNEDAYKAQGAKLTEVENLYNEVNILVSSSESYNGTNYQAAFKAAVEKLTKLNTQIKKYGNDKDTWYASGACHTQDAGASTIASYGDQLTTIKQEWESGDNSYNAAVAADNLNLKKEYDTKWQKLYDFYYGTPTQKGAIDNVTRLKSLTVYSDQVTESVKEIASGDNSIYTKAAKIQELKDKADAAFAALEAGKNWVAGQAAQIDAVDALKAEIDQLQKTYAAAINALINTDYNTALGKANAAVAEAEQAVQVVLGVTDAEEKEKLVELAKANNQTVYDIVKRAVDIKKEVDFAYLFVEENTKSLLETTVPALCLDAKNLAAQKKYAEVYDQINTANEAAQIAEFYYTENYATSSKSSDFTKGGYSDAYAQYLEDEWQYVHSTSLVSMKNYTNAIGNLNRQLTNYTVVKTDGTTESKLCTSAFYEAWDANEQYNTILKAEVDLAAAQVELDAAKAKAKNYAANLLVEHDATIEKKLDDIKIATADKKDLALIQVDQAIKDIFKKEYVTLGLEITKLVQLQGEPTEASDALNATNERIYSDLTSGKKNADGTPVLDKDNQPVKATFDETYEAYLQLEKDLSDELNKVVENALPDAQAAVAAAVAEAKAAVAVAAEKQQAAHAKNMADFADDIEALNAALTQLDKKIELQGNAIVLEKDNNIKSAQDIKANATTTAYDIDLKETYYVANDNIVEGFDEDIENLNNKLTRTVASINALEYIASINENKGWWNNDYAKYVSESVLPEIEKIKNAKAQLEGVLDANDGKFDKWNVEVDKVKAEITSQDNFINSEYSYALKSDAYCTRNALAKAFSDLETYVKNTLTMDTEEKASVDQQIKDLNNKINRVNEYLELVFPSWWENDEIVWLDRDVYGNQEVENVDDKGNPIYKWYSITREQGHAQYKAACAEIVKEMQDIRNSIVTPGAIIDGNEVSGADVAIMVDFILEKKAPETDAQRKAADVNGNGVFDVADLQAIVNMFLYGKYKGQSKAPARQAVNAETIGSMGMFLNTSELNLTLDTEMAYTAVQMDVTLPAGVILTDAAMAAQAEGVSVKFNKVAENTWRVLAFSSQNHNIIEGLDFINLGLAGQGAGVVSIDNVKGAMTRGVLVSIPGVQQNMEVATGINATLAQAKAYIYGIDGTVRESIGKGINIVKDAANKVKKVLKK